jgi:hypothetical protein
MMRSAPNYTSRQRPARCSQRWTPPSTTAAGISRSRTASSVVDLVNKGPKDLAQSQAAEGQKPEAEPKNQRGFEYPTPSDLTAKGPGSQQAQGRKPEKKEESKKKEAKKKDKPR